MKHFNNSAILTMIVVALVIQGYLDFFSDWIGFLIVVLFALVFALIGLWFTKERTRKQFITQVAIWFLIITIMLLVYGAYAPPPDGPVLEFFKI